jgi:trans-2,3-dihydro-3-hydroxyanthranilate isomerase
MAAMSRLHFYLTDVFATTPYTGNQLATVVDSGGLTSREMQRIAIEMNFSETTFVLSNDEVDGGYDVRIFTPTEELDFAGHPSLGTAFVIRRYLVRSKVDRVILNLKVGKIPVDFTEFPEGDIWMEQREPVYGPEVERTAVAEVLSLPLSSLDDRYPVEDVSTGLRFCIVPVKSMNELRSIRLDWERYHLLLEHTNAKGLLAFAPGGYTDEEHFAVRCFVPLLGIPEDPATGSGNGCLAAYLLRHRVTGPGSVDAIVGQGYEIGRPSRIRLRAYDEAGRISVHIGGRVRAVGEGTLY